MILVLFAVLPLGLRLGELDVDIIPVGLYFVWLFVSALNAVSPSITLFAACIDLIFLAIFCLGYIAGANDEDEKTAILMAFSIVPLCFSAWLFFDAKAGRIGLRAYEVAPFIIPFAVHLIYRGKHLAYLSLLATLGFLVVTQSRTPIAAGLGALIVSAVWMAPNVRKFCRLVVILLVAAIIAIPIVLRSDAATLRVAHTISRITGDEVDVDDVVIKGESVDPVRERINELSLKLLRNYNPLGIGYENFQKYYEKEFGEPVVLHSMYATWIIELGVPGVVLALLIAGEAARRIVIGLRRSRYWRAPAVGLLVAAIFGLFHQPHQSPGLWLMLGLVFGMSTRSNHQYSDARTDGLRLCGEMDAIT